MAEQKLADVARRQMAELAAYQTFEVYTTPPVEALAERVASIAPMPDARVFFTSGGSESVDTAAKLVRAYWAEVGAPERNIILSRELAYHGVNAYGTSLGGIPANLAHYDPLVALVERVPHDDAGALRATVDRIGPGRIAAFFCEPVIGAGGVYFPGPGYLEAVAAICREHEILFVADEVITGFGRLGAWFGSTHYGIEPDIVTAAKGISSGYLPLGAVIVGARVAEPFWREGTGAIFRHGYTYSGHTTACAVGVRNLEIVEREGLVSRVRELGPTVRTALEPLAHHALVSEVRAGTGLLGAVELEPEAVAERPSLGSQVAAAARRHGLITRALRGVAFQFSPPFVITEEEIGRVAEILGGALDEVL